MKKCKSLTMKKSWRKLEKIVDKAIFPALFLLLIILVLEIFFHEVVKPYSFYIETLDYLIILIFLIDLIFKYNRVRNINKFLRRYWLEIIAVIPFFLIFRMFEGLAILLGIVEDTAKQSQQILHIGVEAAKEEEVIVKGGKLISEEGKLISSSGRVARFNRFLRPIARLPRFFKLSSKEEESREYLKFFEEPFEDIKNSFKPIKLKK